MIRVLVRVFTHVGSVLATVVCLWHLFAGDPDKAVAWLAFAMAQGNCLELEQMRTPE